MPRISLYRPNKGNDYRLFDNIAREMYIVGGTDMNVYKYKGPKQQTSGKNTGTSANISNPTEISIQDILLLENRDRKYETDTATLRGAYNLQDLDFNLSQFGFILQTDTVYITFHMNDMMDRMGRRLMSGDVLELPHLVDEFPLDPNDEIPIALRKFYVVNEGMRPAEGYSASWYPHLWRVKCTPMIDSPEYRDILDQPVGVAGLGDDDGSGNTLRDFISDYNRYIDVNDAILEQAKIDVPLSGFDTTQLFILPVTGGGPGIGDYTVKLTAMGAPGAPTSDIKVFGVNYLIGDGIPPNGLPVTTGVNFPAMPAALDFHLKTDSLPQRLFQFNGISWIKIEDVERTEMLGSGETNTLIGGFINNSKQTVMQDGTIINEKQGMSKAGAAKDIDELGIGTQLFGEDGALLTQDGISITTESGINIVLEGNIFNVEFSKEFN